MVYLRRVAPLLVKLGLVSEFFTGDDFGISDHNDAGYVQPISQAIESPHSTHFEQRRDISKTLLTFGFIALCNIRSIGGMEPRVDF